MSLWTSSVIALVLLQTTQAQAQEVNLDSKATAVAEVAPSVKLPPRLDLVKRDWTLATAYVDVFKILSEQNSCSSFYGGPRAATMALNDLLRVVQSRQLLRELSFQMGGKLTIIHDTVSGATYRIFDRTFVNIQGSFYQRRWEPMRRLPADVGSFSPGSRRARALILLHELGHLIEGPDGKWLLPDDGFDGQQSNANSLRVEKTCRVQLEALN